MSGSSAQLRRWLFGTALLAVAACGDETLTGPGPEATPPSLDLNLTLANLTVPLTYNGQAVSALGLGQCYNSTYIFAIPTGKTRADNPPPPSVNWCLVANGTPSFTGLDLGEYTIDARLNYWSKTATAPPVTLNLVAGPNTTTFDLAATMGLVTGPLTINGQAPGTDYRICIDDPQVTSTGQEYAGSYCAYLAPLTGSLTTLKMLAPAGTTTAGIFNLQNSTKVATLTFDPVVAGATTTIPATNVAVTDVALQLRFNGVALSTLGLSNCSNNAIAFAIPSGKNRGDAPPNRNGCLRSAPFGTIKGMLPGDYSLELHPNYWSALSFAPPIAMSLPTGVTNATIDLAAGSGIVSGSVSFNGVAAGSDYRVCFDDPQRGPQGEDFGMTSFCVFPLNGAFKMIVPAGVTSLFVSSSSSATKAAVVPFEAIQAGQTLTIPAVNVSTSDLTVRMTYNGQPTTQGGACYNGVTVAAIPSGKTRYDNPPSLFPCLTNATLGTLKGLTPGEYTVDLRTSMYAKFPLAAPVTVTLASGTNTATVDLATASGILAGTLTVNGVPAGTDYRVCYDYQQIGPQNQDYGVTTYCARVSNGSFKLFAPQGSLSASILTSSNQKVASIATAIAAGETTTLGGISVGTPGATLTGTNVEVHPVSGGITDYAATLTFATVTTEGITSLVKSAQGSPPPAGLVLGGSPVYYALSTLAGVSGNIKVCIDYTGTTFMHPAALSLLQRNAANNAWTDITLSRDPATRTICGNTSFLSTFVIAEPPNRAPVIASATGTATDVPAASSLTVPEGTIVTFDGVAADEDGDQLTYTWSYADAAANQSGPSVQRGFGDNTATAVTATLTVKDAFGGSATKAVQVTVTNVAPTATFTASTESVVEGAAFTLELSNVTDVAGDHVQYSFDCGTGGGYGDFGASSTISCTASLAGQRTVQGRVRDKDGGTSEYSATIAVRSANRAPVADPGSNAAGGIYRGSEGVSITFDGSGSADPDGDAIAWEWNFDGSVGQDGLREIQARTAEPTFSYLDDGTYSATLTVRDAKGGSDTRSVQVIVANLNPAATFTATPASLRSGGSFTIALANATDQGPADRAAGFTYALHCGDTPAPTTFTFTATASATCNTTASRASVSRTVLGVVRDKDGGVREYNATVNVGGNSAPALTLPASYRANEGQSIDLGWMGSDAEGDAVTYSWDFGNGVSGSGASLPDSYTYQDNPSGAAAFTITVTANDGLGAVSRTATASIANIAPTVGALGGLALDPAAVGSAAASMTITAPFTDPSAADTHNGSLACGNGTTVPATISGGIASGRCTYGAAGVYRPSMTVTDDDGGSTTRVADSYVVAYDPSAGFVTGGGWIKYDAESCTICGGRAGRGDFGFVARYQKGASQPSGETRFEFHAGALTFASYEYEWLVVGGNRAQFRGSGRINGQGDYRFTLTAVDGSPDTFRIQIWEMSKAEGAYIFDNRGDTALDKVNGGGSITIHSK